MGFSPINCVANLDLLINATCCLITSSALGGVCLEQFYGLFLMEVIFFFLPLQDFVGCCHTCWPRKLPSEIVDLAKVQWLGL
jgi:hypothetical protein